MMSCLDTTRRIAGDWYDGSVPDGVMVHPDAYIETAFSFDKYRSELPEGIGIGRGSSIYLGVMFDVGSHGKITIGDYSLLNGVQIICDARVDIGDHVLISWGVVLCDSERRPADAHQRRWVLDEIVHTPRRLQDQGCAQPIRIGNNVWIGFDVCILPGVTIGEGSIVGARSVVVEDVPPYCLAAGNPARVIRKIK